MGDEHFGAPWNAKGLPRPNWYRNGLKERELRTRMGTLKLRLPQARNGSFFPSCLERWQTSEQALAATLGEMVIILDRPLHHSHIVTIKGESYLLREKRRAGIVPAPEVAD